MALKRNGVLGIAVLACMLVSGIAPSWADPQNPEKWKLTFSDEFNGKKLDTTKWITTYPWERRTTPSNNELEWYVDDAFEFTGNTIKIHAKKVAEKDKKLVNNYGYTSGILTTWNKFSQKYGYFEMRAKLPKGKGFWPAFWLLPASGKWPPEIDIMENLGHIPNRVTAASHFVDKGVQKQLSGQYSGPDFTTGFHTFAGEWDDKKLTFYVDGYKRAETIPYQAIGVPQEAMYLLVNLAVGGNWPGAPDANTAFPSNMEIDYIRVWQKK